MMGRAGSAFDIDRMTALAMAGLGAIRIGRAVGCSPNTVRYHLRSTGVTLDGRSNTEFQLKYWTDPDAFTGESAASQWALGLMASDGNVRSKAAQIRFGQSAGNKGFLDALKIHIGHSGEPYFQASTNSYMLSWTSRRHVADLGNYGIIDNKSLTYSLPDLQRMTWEFIRGYIDGDGTVGVYSNGTHRKYLRISWVGTPKFIAQCADWIPIQGRRYSRGSVEEIVFFGKKAIEIGKLIYKDHSCFKSRKYITYIEAQ